MEELRADFARLLAMDVEDLDVHVPLLEVGADSILFARAVADLKRRYGVEVQIARFFAELRTLDALAGHVAASVPPGFQATAPTPPATAPPPAAPAPAPAQAQPPGPPYPSPYSYPHPAYPYPPPSPYPYAYPWPPGWSWPPPAPVPAPGAAPGPPVPTPEAPVAPPPPRPEPLRRGLPDTVPFTATQKNLRLLFELAPDGELAYNEPFLAEIRGPLRFDALDSAFQELAARHEALRTRIRPGDATQRVLGQGGVPVSLLDLSGGGPRRAGEKARRHVAGECRHRFDLSSEPPLYVHVLRLGRERYQLLIHAQHFLVDGYSLVVLLDELSELYAAACRGTAPELEPAQRWRDYVLWQEERRGSEAWRRQADGWLGKLEDPPLLELPGDRPRPATKTWAGARLRLRLDGGLCQGLRQLGRREGATFFMTFFTGFTLLLHRLSAQDDVLAGVSALGRGDAATRDVVGFCSHAMPLRSRLDRRAPALVHLKATRQELLLAYERHDVPLALLLERLERPLDPGRGQLLDVAFNMEPYREPTLGELPLRLLEAPVLGAKYDLLLNVTDLGGEGAVVDCDYSTELYDATTVRRMASAWRVLLGALASGAGQAAGALPLLDAAQRHQLLAEANDSAADFPRGSTLAELFAAQTARTPNAMAVEDGEESLTYAELAERAGVLAGELRGLGVGPDRVVALRMERGVEMVVATVGVVLAGGAYLPLDPETPEERVAFMIEDAGAVPVFPCHPDGEKTSVGLGVGYLRPRSESQNDPRQPGLRHLHLRLDRRAQGRRRSPTRRRPSRPRH